MPSLPAVVIDWELMTGGVDPFYTVFVVDESNPKISNMNGFLGDARFSVIMKIEFTFVNNCLVFPRHYVASLCNRR